MHSLSVRGSPRLDFKHATVLAGCLLVQAVPVSHGMRPGPPSRARCNTPRNLRGLVRSVKQRRGTQRCAHCAAKAGGAASSGSPLSSAWTFIDANFLPLGLATALSAGIAFPQAALAARDAHAGVIATTIIFVISGALGLHTCHCSRGDVLRRKRRPSLADSASRCMRISHHDLTFAWAHVSLATLARFCIKRRPGAGLQMRRGEAREALQHGWMFAAGMLAILFATPCIGYLVLQAPIAPVEFAYGLAVFCCMPTSLSANIALAGVRTQPVPLLGSSAGMLAVLSIKHPRALMLWPFVANMSLLSMARAQSLPPIVCVILALN
jgi:hypothetical protein